MDHHFALSAGSFTQAGGAFAFTAADSHSPFDVEDDYRFQGGSASVAEPIGGRATAGFLGRLVVSPPEH